MFIRTSQLFKVRSFVKASPLKFSFREYAAKSKISHRAVGLNTEIPTPTTLRILRLKEHRLRRSLLGGILIATAVGYYLDGKYNARAIRRTLRTAWVGAVLAADYKWNFTYSK